MGDFDQSFGPDFAVASEPQDLLPPNKAPFEEVSSRVSHRILETDVGVVERARDPMAADAPFVPLIGAERAVHHPTAGTALARRQRAAQSFADHQSYGAPAALEAEIALDTGEAPENIRVKEFWTERDLSFPDFVVEALRQPGDDMPDLRPHYASAMRRKNVRDWLKVRAHYSHPPGRLFHGAAANISIRVRTVDAKRANLFHGAVARALITQRTSL